MIKTILRLYKWVAMISYGVIIMLYKILVVIAYKIIKNMIQKVES